MNFVSADALLLHIDLECVTIRIHVSLKPNDVRHADALRFVSSWCALPEHVARSR